MVKASPPSVERPSAPRPPTPAPRSATRPEPGRVARRPGRLAALPEPGRVAVLPEPEPGPVAVLSEPEPGRVAVLPEPNRIATLPEPGRLAALPRPTRLADRLMPSHVAALAAALTLGAGCRSSADLGMVGVSDQAPRSPRPRPPASALPVTSSWATPQAFASLAAVDNRPLPSLGHNPPAWAGVVHVSPGLESSYQTLGAAPEPWPPGALIVERHTKPDGSPGPAYAMRKLELGAHPGAGDWSYAVLASDGTPQEVGDLSFCARCHADAPHQFLFGPRAEARRRLHGAPNGPGTDPARGSPPPDEAASPPEDTPPPTKGTSPPPHPAKR